MDLQNRVAIVTGGASGIGRTISLALAKKGAYIVVNYNRSKDKALALVREIEDLGSKALAVQADISIFDEAKKLVEACINQFKKIDILVNNAGVTQDKLILRMQEEDYDKVLDTNLKGAWNMSKHAAKYLLKSPNGRVINISSVTGLMGNVGQTNYSASKAGLIGLTKSLARELASRAVTVNAICPGFIETDMTASLDQKLIDAYLNTIPLKRLGKPEDIGNMVAFLSSDLASYITGQTLVVDGGMVM